jgi:hypothetical protein
MPTPASQPTPGRARDTKSTRVALCDIPLRDAEGTDIRLRCRMEQIAVDQARGALPDRLHQQGDVIGQSAALVYVRFDHGNQGMVALRPHLVRVLDAPQ